MPAAKRQMLSPCLVLYDGECGLCQRTVKWLLQHDPTGALRFAPLQGKTATVLRDSGIRLPASIGTVAVVVTVGSRVCVLDRSRAILKICEVLRLRPWWVRLLELLPRPLADAGYRLVAATRYAISRRISVCPFTNAEQQSRFLP